MVKIYVLKSIIYDTRFDSSVFYESNPLYFRVTDQNYRKMTRYEKWAKYPCCVSKRGICKFLECFCAQNTRARSCSFFNDYKLYVCPKPQMCHPTKKQKCDCKSKRRSIKFLDNRIV